MNELSRTQLSARINFTQNHGVVSPSVQFSFAPNKALLIWEKELNLWRPLPTFKGQNETKIDIQLFPKCAWKLSRNLRNYSELLKHEQILH